MARYIQNIRTKSLATLALCGMLFTGCLTAAEENTDQGLATVALEIRPGKSSAVSRLGEMVVTLASTAGDTLRDTITESGSRLSKSRVRLNPPAEESQVIHPVYDLDPAFDWAVSVKTLDRRDSVMHHDSAVVTGLAARHVRNVTMRLTPRFAAYEAVFSLPASLAKANLQLSGVDLALNGVTVCDTALATAVSTVKLHCEDLPAGTHTVIVRAYGRLPGESAARLLFKGEQEANITAATTPVETMSLNWAAGEAPAAAEQDDALGMSMRLGRVGQVVMNVVISGGVSL